MPHIRFFTRAGCGLCDTALALVELELSRALGPPRLAFAPCTCGPTSVARRVEYADRSLLEVIDIDAEPELGKRFGSEVPVVEVVGGPTFACMLDAEAFSRAVGAALTVEATA